MIQTQTDPNTMLKSVVDLISSHTKGCHFASLTYTAKGTGEVAKHQLRLGVNFENMYQKDVELLAGLLPTFSENTLQHQACRALMDSLTESLTLGIGQNTKYTLKDHFVTSLAFPNIKILLPNDSVGARDVGLYITAVSDGKTVITPGVYKDVNSAPLTKAKNELRKLLRTDKLRTFHLRNISRAAMFGDVLELDGDCG